MTVRLQKPFKGQNVSTLYTGADGDALVIDYAASKLPTTGAGTGPAAPAAAVILSQPVAGQGVGAVYLGSNPTPAQVVANGWGYYEGTTNAGAQGSGPVPPPPVPDPVTYDDSTAMASTLWAGHVTPSSGRVAVTTPAEQTVRLVASTSSDLTADPKYGPPVTTATGADSTVQAALLSVDGLAPNTNYHYGVRVGNTVYRSLKGKFRTAGNRATQRMVFGNCSTGSDSSNPIWAKMIELNPDIALNLGDLHYSDELSMLLSEFDINYDGRLNSPGNSLSRVMREMPFYYIWGDHDFAQGDSLADSNAPNRNIAIAAFRKRVPSPPLDKSGATEHIGFGFEFALTNGATERTVLVLCPDQRSNRLGGTSNIMGTEQRDEFIAKLVAAAAAGKYVIYVTESQTFGEYDTATRTAIWTAIRDNGLEGQVLVIEGNGHEVGADDGGRSNAFISGGGCRTPILLGGSWSKDDPGQFVATPGAYSHGRGGYSSRQFGCLDMALNSDGTLSCQFDAYSSDRLAAPFLSFPFTLSLAGYIAPAIYAIDNADTSVNEGGTTTFTIASNNPGGSVVVELSGPSAADIVGGQMTRTVQLDGSGNGSLAVQFAEDLTTEGNETLTARIRATPWFKSVVVNDTSQSNQQVIVQKYGYNGRNLQSVTNLPITLAAPATAGNWLIAYMASDKIATSYTVPTGYTKLAEHVTGTGVSVCIYAKQAEGGETQIPAATQGTSTFGSFMGLEVSRTASIDKVAIDTTLASVTGKSNTVTTAATDTADELAIAFWHNDGYSATTTASLVNSGWSEGWAVQIAGGISASHPVIPPPSGTVSSSAPAFSMASRTLTATGPVSATFSYTGGTASDESIAAIVTLRKAP